MYKKSGNKGSKSNMKLIFVEAKGEYHATPKK